MPYEYPPTTAQRQAMQYLRLPDPFDYGSETTVHNLEHGRVMLLHQGTEFKPALLLKLGVAISYVRAGRVWAITARKLRPVSGKFLVRADEINEKLCGPFTERKTVLQRLQEADIMELRAVTEFVATYDSPWLYIDCIRDNWMRGWGELLPIDVVAERLPIY